MPRATRIGARMRKRKGSDAYMAELEKSYSEIIDDLDLHDLHKRFLRDRWLNELLWFEERPTAASGATTPCGS